MVRVETNYTRLVIPPIGDEYQCQTLTVEFNERMVLLLETGLCWHDCVLCLAGAELRTALMSAFATPRLPISMSGTWTAVYGRDLVAQGWDDSSALLFNSGSNWEALRRLESLPSVLCGGGFRWLIAW